MKGREQNVDYKYRSCIVVENNRRATKSTNVFVQANVHQTLNA